MTALNSPLSFLAFRLADVLDAVALLAVKLRLIEGVHVFHTPGRDWRADVWKEQGLCGPCWTIQLGSFDAVVDLRVSE